MTTVAVHGARGYAGRELIRLLLNHPHVDRIIPISGGAAGDDLGKHVPSLRHAGLTLRGPDALTEADVVFLATDDQTATQTVPALRRDQLVIDLSRAHRQEGLAKGGPWEYGWADIQPVPEGTKRIANPGCYPTSAALAITPLMRAGLCGDGPIIVDGKSGVSGAGATPRPDLHFAEANESVRAYKVHGHDHRDEIQSVVHSMAAKPTHVRFTPHLVPQTRGLLTTTYIPCRDDVDDVTLAQLVHDTYAGSPFVHETKEPDTAHVRGSNHAHISVHCDKEAGLLVARCAIDNLQKGAAGTAIQNMNDACGWASDAGLTGAGA